MSQTSNIHRFHNWTRGLLLLLMLCTNSDANVASKVAQVGELFFAPWLRMMPKNFSKGFWSKCLHQKNFILKSEKRVFFKITMFSIVFPQLFIEETLPVIRLEVTNLIDLKTLLTWRFPWQDDEFFKWFCFRRLI